MPRSKELRSSSSRVSLQLIEECDSRHSLNLSTPSSRAEARSADIADLVSPALTRGAKQRRRRHRQCRQIVRPLTGVYFFGEVQELDIRPGQLLFSWRSDEYVPLKESYAAVPRDGATPWDYFHLNSINVDPLDENLVVSGRNTWGVYKIHRGTGEVLWRLGGKASQFKPDVTPQRDETLTIFDNEGSPFVRPPSRGLVLSLDTKARVTKLLHEYLHSPPLDVAALDSVQDLPDGHVFVGWGTPAYFTEYGQGGTVLLDGRLEGKGVESYRAFKQGWVGRPSSSPPWPSSEVARPGTYM